MMAEEDNDVLISHPLMSDGTVEEDDVKGSERESRKLGDPVPSGEGGEVCCGEGEGCYPCRDHRPLSVQSGDIIPPPSPSPSPSPHGKVYTKLFPFVHAIIKRVFFTVDLCNVTIPLAAIAILILMVLVTFALGCVVWIVYQPTFNINIESVQIPNHPSSKHWDAYQAALEQHILGSPSSSSSEIDNTYPAKSSKDKLNDNSRNDGAGSELKSVGKEGGGRCCDSSIRHQRKMHGTWILEMVYQSKNGESLLENKHIEYLNTIEEHIYNLSEYKSVCHFAYTPGVCDPINSILTYLYPRNPDGSLVSGKPIEDWKTRFDPAQLNTSQLEQLLWYTGGKVGDNYSTPLLRAQVRVGVPLPCYCSYQDRKEEQYKIVSHFFISLIPFLDKASNKDIRVLYGGAEIFDYEVNQAKLHDIKLATVTVAIIVVAMFILTGFSPFLTVWGIIALVMCWVLATFVYRVVLQYETFSLLSIVTLFVIIGIGVDDVFVFLNTFKQSQNLEGLDSVHKRLTHTIIVATSATFFTSATTAIAFLANAVSEIPAVRQFAIFTGLVVFFCFVTVAMTMPLFLHIWQCGLLALENFIFKPCYLLASRRSPPTSYSVVPPIRMTDLKDVETDSGILEDRNSDSLGSDSNSLGSHSSTSSLLDEQNVGMEPAGSSEIGTEVLEVVPGMEESQHENETVTDAVSRTGISPENRLTVFVQKVLLHSVARIVMLPQLTQYTFIPNTTVRAILRWVTRLIPVIIFVVILISMGGAMSQLKPSNHPPQFFDPDSNIQRMLDLQGNLTQRAAVNCWDCSAWYNKSGAGGGVVNPGDSGGPTSSSGTTTEGTAASTASPPTPSDSTEPPSSQPTSTTKPTTNPTTNTPTTPPSDPTNPSTDTDTPTDPASPSSSDSTHPTPGTTPTDMPTPTNSPSQSVATNLLNNVAVYVVFGVKGVKREYSTSHVLPTEGEGRQAILNPAFSSTLTCPPSSFSSPPPLIATVRAMCRICSNISNPARGLVLSGSFNCFPAKLRPILDNCLYQSARKRVTDLEECRTVKDSTNAHIEAEFNYTVSSGDQKSLQFLAMAFRTTTSPSDSATENIEQYYKWEDALRDELDAIERLSGPGEPYEGAWDALSPTFQTSEYWVMINTEIIAIRGSFYGILISIVLCAVVVALLSNNGPVVIAMGLTILGILVTLLGLFQLFGWTLGIIEAVSLSILVGNSLDYCIHLSEGYMATDQRHLTFLSHFKFTHSASPRVKRVLSAISFIGVSILSSAVTTFLAILPLLAAKILLFTRFAQILILDTVIAILFTLFFCGTFLSLFGPVGRSRNWVRITNGAVTIFVTVVAMVIVFVVATQVMAHYNII